MNRFQDTACMKLQTSNNSIIKNSTHITNDYFNKYYKTTSHTFDIFKQGDMRRNTNEHGSIISTTPWVRKTSTIHDLLRDVRKELR